MNGMEAGRRMVMHPAWQAAHELLSDSERWWRTLSGETGGYSTRQIATAMQCMGFGDDLIVTRWHNAFAVDWELPACWIPENPNKGLDAYPRLLAMLDLHADEDRREVDESNLPVVRLRVLNGALA